MYIIPDSSAFKKCIAHPEMPTCRMPVGYDKPTAWFCRRHCMPKPSGKPGDNCPQDCCECKVRTCVDMNSVATGQNMYLLFLFLSSQAPGFIDRLKHYLIGGSLMGIGSYLQLTSGIAPFSVMLANALALAVFSNTIMAIKCDYDGLEKGQGCF
jgi:hypothetical protein